MDHPNPRNELGQSKKHNKIAKEKVKAKELQRYMRKVQLNVETGNSENKSAEASVKDYEKGVGVQHSASVKSSTPDVQQGSYTFTSEKEHFWKDEHGHNAIEADVKGVKHRVKTSDHNDGTAALPSEMKQVPTPSVDNMDEIAEDHHIFRLKKKSSRFPDAKFFCRLCNYHLDTFALCMKHWKERRHSKLEETKSILKEIKCIGAPSKLHNEALTSLLNDIVHKSSLTANELVERAKIAERVEQVLLQTMPDTKVTVYGSSLSGFGFHDSDVNMNIEASEGTLPSQILVAAIDALMPADIFFEEVQSDFDGRFPCIRFKDKHCGLRCELSTGSVSAVKTSKLLLEYCQFDPRVHQLAMGLRYWARLCGVDSQSDGSMPSYSFVLMTIFFMQHCTPPVLPVLQEKKTLEQDNTDTLGELWIKMLRFYAAECAMEEIVISIRKSEAVSRDELKIPNRRLAIEDPIAVNKKNIAKSLSSNIVFEYIMERLQCALLYFGKKVPCSGTSMAKPTKHYDTSHVQDYFQCKCKGKACCENNACIMHTETCSHGSQDGAIAHCCQLTTCYHNDIPKDTAEANDGASIQMNSTVNKVVRKETLIEGKERTSPICEMPSKGSPKSTQDETQNQTSLDEMREGLKTPVHCHREVETIDKSQVICDKEGFNFVFDEKILTGGKKVMIVCNACGKEGHQVSQCPDDILPKLVVLPLMENSFLKRINALCKNVEERFCLKDWAINDRDKAVSSYERIIRQNGYQDAELSLFGSSRNGFGFVNSDLDICLKLQKHKNAEGINIPYLIEDLAKKLKRHPHLRHIIPIPTAKVPIVKFFDPLIQLDVDISLYNCLAQANTRMLYVYSKIDPRVRQLVYTAKVFAKVCDIGDASKGSLSSYAYTLMTIYFLQQRQPPVLPVLQEMHQGKEKPKDAVEGWNAWFFGDLRKLFHVWKVTNKESVGELWIGFLRFFTEEFNSKKNVVCIRQLKPLTRFEKMWCGAVRGFAIEDPFDLDHNLGSGVSRKMATFIMQVFIKAREHFGTPNRVASRNDFEYFFDDFVLTGGETPPNDRCCKVCGKIGHFLKDCPRRKGHRETGRSKDGEEKMSMKKDRPKRDIGKDEQHHRKTDAQPPRMKPKAFNAGHHKESVQVATHLSEMPMQATSVETTVYYSQVSGKPSLKHHVSQEEKRQQRKQDAQVTCRSKAESGNNKEPALLSGQRKVQAPQSNMAVQNSSGNLSQCQQQQKSPQARQPAKLSESIGQADPKTCSEQSLHEAIEGRMYQTQTSPSCQSGLPALNSSPAGVPDLQHASHMDNKWQQHEIQPSPAIGDQNQRAHYVQDQHMYPDQYQQHGHNLQQQQLLHKQQQQQNWQKYHHEQEQHLHQQHQLVSTQPGHHSVIPDQTFSFAKLTQFANVQNYNRDLPPNEVPMTLEDVEAMQQSKQQVKQESGNLSIQTTPSRKHASAVGRQLPTPSSPELDSAKYGAAHGASWTQDIISSPPMPAYALHYNWPSTNNHTQQGHCAANSPPYPNSHCLLSEENNIGSALLQGVSILKKSDSGSNSEAFGPSVQTASTTTPPGHHVHLPQVVGQHKVNLHGDIRHCLNAQANPGRFNQHGVNQQGPHHLVASHFGAHQLGVNQFGTNQPTNQHGVNQLATTHPGTNQLGTNQVRVDQQVIHQFGPNSLRPNQQGIDQQGINQQGINQQGINQQGINQQGINQQGINQQRINHIGTNEQGIYLQGINQQGLNQQGLNQQGINQQGINQQGINQQGLNQQGLNQQGINQQGINQQGLNQQGLNQQGLNQQGINQQGINQQGINQQGINQQGIDQQGINQQGINQQGINNIGTNEQGIYLQGINQLGTNQHGIYQQGVNQLRTNQQGINQQVANQLGTNEQGIYLQGANQLRTNQLGTNQQGINQQGINQQQKVNEQRIN